VLVNFLIGLNSQRTSVSSSVAYEEFATDRSIRAAHKRARARAHIYTLTGHVRQQSCNVRNLHSPPHRDQKSRKEGDQSEDVQLSSDDALVGQVLLKSRPVLLQAGIESLVAERRVRIDVADRARNRPRRIDDEHIAILGHRILNTQQTHVCRCEASAQ
jgi:hypothetical protein